MGLAYLLANLQETKPTIPCSQFFLFSGLIQSGMGWHEIQEKGFLLSFKNKEGERKIERRRERVLILMLLMAALKTLVGLHVMLFYV